MSRPPILAAAIALIVVAAIGAVVVGSSFWRSSSPPTPSDSSPAPIEEPSPAAADAVAAAQGLTLRYPASWFLHDVTEMDLGHGSSDFVLTSKPFPADCNDPASDLNCLFKHPMDPGSVRIVVGQASTDVGAMFDPQPVVPGVRITRGVVAGMPALLLDRGAGNGWAFDLTWKIAVPDSVQRYAVIEASGTDPGDGVLRATVERIVGSAAQVAPPKPVPSDEARRSDAARSAKVTAVTWLRGEDGMVVTGARATEALDDCFEAGVDRPATMRIQIDSDVLPTGPVDITCTVSAELIADAYWKVTIAGRSGAGSTVPGTTATVTVWITTAGDWAGDTRNGVVPAARAPGFLRMDATGAAGAAQLAAEFDADDSDFYQCFLARGPRQAVTIGPDHRAVGHIIDLRCTAHVAFAPDGNAFLVTQTAAWPEGSDYTSGTMIVRLEVGTDGSIRGPTIEGDPLP